MRRFLEGDLSAAAPLFRSRALWTYLLLGIVGVILQYITQPQPSSDPARNIGYAIGMTLVPLILIVTPSYLLLLGLEFLIRRANLSPAQTRIAITLAAFVALAALSLCYGVYLTTLLQLY